MFSLPEGSPRIVYGKLARNVPSTFRIYTAPTPTSLSQILIQELERASSRINARAEGLQDIYSGTRNLDGDTGHHSLKSDSGCADNSGSYSQLQRTGIRSKAFPESRRDQSEKAQGDSGDL